MQQAVLVTAYTNMNHLFEIVDFLTGDFVFYIHIDKKSNVSNEEILNLRKKRNVVLVSQKYDVNWGSINHLKAILYLLQNALEDTSNTYFHLITGHDFPIKSPQDITNYLIKNKGKEYLEYSKLPYGLWENGGYDRILYYNMYDVLNARTGWRKGIVRRLLSFQKKNNIKRSFPKSFPEDLYGGGTYWTLSRAAIKYVFDYMKENPSFLKRFKCTFCSEEMFFHTLILNSPLKGNVINNNLRFIVWEERNGNIPANLDETDLGAIKSSEALFARKFDYPVSELLLRQIKDFFRRNEN